ncbi:MAG: hypothetical protein WC371_04905 [Parachlamydiales bacterium]|jgi:hypothetical protein
MASPIRSPSLPYFGFRPIESSYVESPGVPRARSLEDFSDFVYKVKRTSSFERLNQFLEDRRFPLGRETPVGQRFSETHWNCLDPKSKEAVKFRSHEWRIEREYKFRVIAVGTRSILLHSGLMLLGVVFPPVYVIPIGCLISFGTTIFKYRRLFQEWERK